MATSNCLGVAVTLEDVARTAHILRTFKAVASDDALKHELELTCLVCGERVCAIEHDDTLRSLVFMAENHNCPVTP